MFERDINNKESTEIHLYKVLRYSILSTACLQMEVSFELFASLIISHDALLSYKKRNHEKSMSSR